MYTHIFLLFKCYKTNSNETPSTYALIQFQRVVYFVIPLQTCSREGLFSLVDCGEKETRFCFIKRACLQQSISRESRR